jgi:hypothetical protein
MEIGSQFAHARLGATDSGQYREAAGDGAKKMNLIMQKSRRKQVRRGHQPGPTLKNML